MIHYMAEVNRESYLSTQTRQKIYIDKVMESAGNGPMTYDTYIKLQMGPAAATGSVEEMKDSVARIMAAGLMKSARRAIPVNEATIKSAVNKTRIMCGINDMSEDALKAFLKDRDNVSQSIKERANASFGPIEGMFNRYLSEMQELYKKLPEPGNDPNYKKIFDNVKLMAHLPENSKDCSQKKLSEAICVANFEMVISAEKILKGNENLKKGACEPTLDVLATIHKYIGHGSDLIDGYVENIDGIRNPNRDSLFNDEENKEFSLEPYGPERIKRNVRELDKNLALDTAEKLKEQPKPVNNPQAAQGEAKAGNNNAEKEEPKIRVDMHY